MTVSATRTTVVPDLGTDFGIAPNVWSASHHHVMHALEVPRLSANWHASADSELGPVPHDLIAVFDVSECTPVGGALLSVFVAPVPGGNEFLLCGQTLAAAGQVRISIGREDLSRVPWPSLWLSVGHTLQSNASIAYRARLVAAR